jgi:hypothetical protein
MAHVRQISPPPVARRLSTLPRIDYADAFTVEVRAGDARPAEEWARAMLENAPPDTRRALHRGWSSLGLRRGSMQDADRILGWEVVRSSPAYVLLHADSPLGLVGELLYRREPDAVLFSTLVELKNPLIRAIWAAVIPGHQRTVRSLLEQMVAREKLGTEQT